MVSNHMYYELFLVKLMWIIVRCFFFALFKLKVEEDKFLQNTLNRAQIGRIKNLEKLATTVDDSK